MEIRQRIYQWFFILLLEVLLNAADGSNITWEVKKKVIKYGDDLSLFCQVENCCQESTGWGKWTSKTEFTTIFIDVKNLTVDKSQKYGGSTNERGFFLDIRNFTRKDLNVTYSCTYGFQVSKKKMLTKTGAFVNLDLAPNDDDSKTSTIRVIIPVLFAVVVSILVGGSIFFHRRYHTKSTQEKADENQTTDINFSAINQIADEPITKSNSIQENVNNGKDEERVIIPQTLQIADNHIDIPFADA